MAMKIDPAVRELLVEPVLEGNATIAIDDFKLKNNDDEEICLDATIECNGSGDLGLELRDLTGRDLSKLFTPDHDVRPEDTLSASGMVAGRVPIIITKIWPPTSSTTKPIGEVQTSFATTTAERIELGYDQENHPEDSDVEEACEDESVKFNHLAIFSNAKLKFKNSSQRWTRSHEFWGTASGSNGVSWDGEALGGYYSILQDGDHLMIGFRHEAASIEQARHQMKALLAAICYTHGLNPWPSYFRLSEGEHVIEEWVKPVGQVQGQMNPLRERHGLFYPDAPSNLVAAVGAWLCDLDEAERKEINHALWVFRSMDFRAATMPVQLAMVGAVIEGLFNSCEGPVAPEAFNQFKEEAIAWAKHAAQQADESERRGAASRLASHLGRWEYQDRRTMWKTTFGDLLPGREEWLEETYRLYQKHRHPPAHGNFVRAVEGDSGELIRALGRLAGFVNIILAAKAGYTGPILESPFSDREFDISPRPLQTALRL